MNHIWNKSLRSFKIPRSFSIPFLAGCLALTLSCARSPGALHHSNPLLKPISADALAETSGASTAPADTEIPASADSEPLRARPILIMPLGASITQGVGSTKSGYRNVLDDLLTKANISHEFVGSSVAQPSILPADQTHHEGHPGYVITAGTSGRAGVTDNLANWLGASGPNPDYILLLLGSNDVDLNYKLSEAGARMDNLITMISDKAKGLRPNAHLIITTLPLVNDAAAEARSKTFNAAIMEVAAKHKAAGENVSTVDVHAVITPADKFDNLHPNDLGYQKIAAIWFNAITAP